MTLEFQKEAKKIRSMEVLNATLITTKVIIQGIVLKAEYFKKFVKTYKKIKGNTKKLNQLLNIKKG